MQSNNVIGSTMKHTQFPSQFRVPYDQSFQVKSAITAPSGELDSTKQLKKQLSRANDKLYELQRMLYAHNKYSVLLVFQAMDAAGKDSTIRTVMRGVNPAGCQVFSFKQPSSEELDHDFLWRSARRLPERGRIGIFNRSYYEEVLVVRVHPEYLGAQRLIGDVNTDEFWNNRLKSIRDSETHLANNGTVILKFWLNVSKEEQKRRFIERLDNPKKNWKFSSSDVAERQHWDAYMKCYEAMLNASSTEHAPWYAIPADNKPFARLQIANTIIETIASLDMNYPSPEAKNLERFDEWRAQLEAE